MSCCGQSQRVAAQLLEYETIAKDKFPKWDANARYYYDTIKDKDRDGNIKMHSLDHYLYHTYFHNMREDRLKQVQSDEQSADASAGKLPEAPAAAGNPPKAKLPMARCDNESSDDPSSAMLETVPKKSVQSKAKRDNAADSPNRKNHTSGDGCCNAGKYLSQCMDSICEIERFLWMEYFCCV